MPTTKKRLNISLSPDLEKVLKMSAKRDNMPQATKAIELIKLALEIEEDGYFGRIAEERMKEKNIKWISHDDFWKKALKK